MECYRSKAASEQWNDGSAGISSYCCCCVGSARKSSTRFHVSCTCWIFRFLFKLHAEYPASGLARWRRMEWRGARPDAPYTYVGTSTHYGGNLRILAGNLSKGSPHRIFGWCVVCDAYVLLCPSALSAPMRWMEGCCVMPHRPLKFPCTVIRH